MELCSTGQDGKAKIALDRKGGALQMPPETRYAKSGGVDIAHQVLGAGPVNLVFAPGFVSNVETVREQPDRSRLMLRLANCARIALFDKRGTGMSDRVADFPGLEQRMDDLRAVMDSAQMIKPPRWAFRRAAPWRCFLRQPTPVDVVRSFSIALLHALMRRTR